MSFHPKTILKGYTFAVFFPAFFYVVIIEKNNIPFVESQSLVICGYMILFLYLFQLFKLCSCILSGKFARECNYDGRITKVVILTFVIITKGKGTQLAIDIFFFDCFYQIKHFLFPPVFSCFLSPGKARNKK